MSKQSDKEKFINTLRFVIKRNTDRTYNIQAVAKMLGLPNDLDYAELASQLTVPENLQDLVRENQIGLVMLKIVEIIGEDNISDLDPETLYFLNKILNDLNLKKIRNSILGEALPAKA